jgi:hypothetical protein
MDREKFRMTDEHKLTLVNLCLQIMPWAAKERGEKIVEQWGLVAKRLNPNCKYLTAQNTFKALMDQEECRRERAFVTGRANNEVLDAQQVTDLENAVAVAYDVYAEYLATKEVVEEKKRKLKIYENEKEEEVKRLRREALDMFKLDGQGDEVEMTTSNCDETVRRSRRRSNETLMFLKEQYDYLKKRDAENKKEREEREEREEKRFRERNEILKAFLYKF